MKKSLEHWLANVPKRSIPVGARQIRDLSKTDVLEILRGAQAVQFVILDASQAPIEIPPKDCYDFWKRDLKSHFPETNPFYLEDFEGEYCYVATDWGLSTDGLPLVILHKCH
jgi:hypothetical protein